MKIARSISVSVLVLLIMTKCGSDDKVEKQDPNIIWESPSDIRSGNPLTAEQLNATASTPGTFIYSPEIGAILSEGENQELTVSFVPTNEDLYASSNKTVFINILPNGNSDAVFNDDFIYGTVSGPDGNAYKTITIGSQTWMAENLRTTKYQNGDEIPEVTSNSAWVTLNTAAYSSYENTSDLDHLATNGRLYNWFAVSDPRNIAPEGWHVATEADWLQLSTALGGLTVVGGKIKESGNTHWNAPNTAANNSSGFTALPSGRREYTDGSFINSGFNGFWWTSTAYNPDYSWYFQVNYDFATLVPANFHKQYGFSVRCVKDL